MANIALGLPNLPAIIWHDHFRRLAVPVLIHRNVQFHGYAERLHTVWIGIGLLWRHSCYRLVLSGRNMIFWFG